MSIGMLEERTSADALLDRDWGPEEPAPQRRAGGSSITPHSFDSHGFVVRWPHGAIEFAERPSERVLSVIRKALDLTALPPNWDSYGARTIDPYLVAGTVELLHTLIGPDTPLPSIVPTSRGGVQLEWHCNEVDLEINVSSPIRRKVFFEDFRSGVSKEFTLTGDLRPLLPILNRLSQLD